VLGGESTGRGFSSARSSHLSITTFRVRPSLHMANSMLHRRPQAHCGIVGGSVGCLAASDGNSCYVARGEVALTAPVDLKKCYHVAANFSIAGQASGFVQGGGAGVSPVMG